MNLMPFKIPPAPLAQTGFGSLMQVHANVAPLAQTGMTGTDINTTVIAPGRAGRAL